MNNYIEINNKINKILDTIDENKNIVFELNDIYYFNDKKKFGNLNISNATIFLKNKVSCCSICYENIQYSYLKKIICKHPICYKCYNLWNKSCIFNNTCTTCPICRIILT